MAEYDPNTSINLIAGAVAAVMAAGVGVREYLKREKLSDATRGAEVNGIDANDKVLKNLVAEVARLSSRVTELEQRVEHLTDKLANVRLIALDCYQLANECECVSEGKAKLLDHLKQIIRDA